MISSFTFTCEIPHEFNSRLGNALGRLGFKPTLAFGFVSIDFPLKEIMNEFQSKGIHLFGSTSAGAISFDYGNDTVLQKGAVFVITDIPVDSFQIEFLELNDHSPENFGRQAGVLIKKPFKSPAVITAFSGFNMDIQTIIENILEETGKHLKMFGNLAGDDYKFKKTRVFTQDAVITQGGIFLILDEEKIDLRGMTSNGWNGLGTDFNITRSEGNVVYEIDSIPALDMYANYLNITEEDLPVMGLEYPLMVKNQDGTKAFRMVTSINKEKRALVFAGSIKQGAVFSFSASPGFEILEKTREKIIEFHENNQQADLMILFSAAAREQAIGPLINTEIKLASLKWKVPLVGCFSYGEIAHENDNLSKFYNQSFTLALLTRKPAHTL
jgi:hypothetical protein